MTTLITGAGMVGSLAAARLIAAGEERPVLYDVGFSMQNLAERVPLDGVALVRGDVNDLPDLVRAIQMHGVTRIIHTAGLLTWMVRERPYAGVRVNFMGTLSVLEAARLAGVERVVLCSSYTVYRGLKQPAPEGELVEDFSLRAISDAPPSVYAMTKLGAEWLGQCYQNEYGVAFAAVRFAGVFGPWHGTPSGGPSQTMARLIESAWRGERCRVSSGDLQRASEYVYAHDAAQGAVKAAVEPRSSKPVYNVGMGRLYSGQEIVELIQELSGRRLELDVYEAGTFSGYENEMLPGNLEHARAEIGFEVEYPMERAIRDYLGWLERHSGG